MGRDAKPHGGLVSPAGGLAEVTPRHVLEIDGLSLGYDAAVLLRIDRMTVGRAEVVALVGRSGSGKTTLLSCLSGHVPARLGSFVLEGALGGRGVRSTFVSRTIQHFPLVHWATVRGNLRLAARIRGVPSADLDQILTNFSADAFADKFPSQLSGGERCRASLSQALLGDPGLLLLDEPFTGLDTLVKRVVASRLFSVARASGAAILFVTHDLNDAVEFSDRVVVLGGHQPVTVAGEVLSRSSDAMAQIGELMAAHP